MTLTVTTRRVSGEIAGQRGRQPERRLRRFPGSAAVSGWASRAGGQPTLCSASAAAGSAEAAPAAGSAIAVSISDAIEGFDLRELSIDCLELFAQTLDVAVDRAVVHVDVLAVRGVHQLVAVFDVAGALCQRLENQEFGDGQLDRLTLPGAQMAGRVEHHLPAHDDRLALRLFAVPGKLAAPDQRPDALDQ